MNEEEARTLLHSYVDARLNFNAKVMFAADRDADESAIDALDDIYRLAEKECIEAMNRPDVRAMTELAIEAGKLKSNNELLLAGCQEWKRIHVHNAEKISEQQREIERLKDLFFEYARHKESCDDNSPKCTCGLDEVLK